MNKYINIFIIITLVAILFLLIVNLYIKSNSEIDKAKRISLVKNFYSEIYLQNNLLVSPDFDSFIKSRSLNGSKDKFRKTFIVDLKSKKFLFGSAEIITKNEENIMSWNCGKYRIDCNRGGGVQVHYYEVVP